MCVHLSRSLFACDASLHNQTLSMDCPNSLAILLRQSNFTFMVANSDGSVAKQLCHCLRGVMSQKSDRFTLWKKTSSVLNLKRFIFAKFYNSYCCCICKFGGCGCCCCCCCCGCCCCCCDGGCCCCSICC